MLDLLDSDLQVGLLNPLLMRGLGLASRHVPRQPSVTSSVEDQPLNHPGEFDDAPVTGWTVDIVRRQPRPVL